MKLLILTEEVCDFSAVLESCGADTDRMTLADALHTDLTAYDAYCVLPFGKILDARLRERLEAENAKGKKVFAEALNTYLGIYSAEPVNTTRSRLIYVEPEHGMKIPGLETGDLLDDECNGRMQPWYGVPGMVPLLVYREHIIAHTHTDMSREDMLKDAGQGLWMVGEHVMMTSFRLHNFNKARFAPRKNWEKLIAFIAEWLTGNVPAYMPAPVVQYGPDADLTDDGTFEKCRREAIERGMAWLREFRIDEGRGGMVEGLCHNIDPEGKQSLLTSVRTDCSGESAGAFRFYGFLQNDPASEETAANLDSFCYGPMLVKGGLFDGMVRWSSSAWQVCYQDDVARAVLPGLYASLFLGKDENFASICRALDFLVKTTAKDGCRVARTDAPGMTEDSIRALAEAEHGLPSAHYNAWYHAALLLAYKHGGNRVYLETAERGLETIMGLYPDTRREQSETEEMCRLVLPLAALYDATGKEEHKAMLYRVAEDLQKYRHPSGGYQEWDTGYKAVCSRESRGECSILTENGDPVADMLYSTNWLPLGFAYAEYATGDSWFRQLWQDVVRFCIRSQVISENPKTNGSWCRAFDMEMGEAYGCPHDAGWAAYASESGWTNAEILMGMMLPEVLKRRKNG